MNRQSSKKSILGYILLFSLSAIWIFDIAQHLSDSGDWLSYRLAGLGCAVALTVLHWRNNSGK